MSTDTATIVDGGSGNYESHESTAVKSAGNLIRYFLKKWWLFAIAGALAGIAGIWYAGKQKAVYESRLSFALDNGSSEGGLLNLASQFGLTVDNGKDIFAGDNILEIMKSRRIVEKVLLSTDSFNNKPYTLIEYYLSLDKKTDTKSKDVHFPAGQPRESFSYLQDSILFITYNAFAGRMIEAQRPDRKLSLFEVKVTTPDEKLTKVFTDRLVNESDNFYVEISSKKAMKTLQVLEDRVAAMKGNLNSSISNRAASQDANLNPAFAAAQVPVIKQQVNMQVYSGAYAEMFKNLELARFQYLKQIPLMQIIDHADYPMKRVTTGKLKTAFQFAVLACLLLLLGLWLIKLFKK